jgi:hypothetical protein
VALLEHESEPEDVILAHVDRIVPQKEVPKNLRDAWKPPRPDIVDLKKHAEELLKKGEAMAVNKSLY